nr:sodium:dicarboxylate symporter family [uncultured bacterium]
MLTVILAIITRQGLLLGALLFVISFVVSLAIVSFILVKIPPDYFKEDHPTALWKGRNPAFRLLGIIGKNLLGVVLVALGIVMSVPGVPGQGILTILLGIMLLDIPGRQKLERKIVSRPRVLKSIDKLRHRFGKPKLQL